MCNIVWKLMEKINFMFYDVVDLHLFSFSPLEFKCFWFFIGGDEMQFKINLLLFSDSNLKNLIILGGHYFSCCNHSEVFIISQNWGVFVKNFQCALVVVYSNSFFFCTFKILCFGYKLRIYFWDFWILKTLAFSVNIE